MVLTLNPDENQEKHINKLKKIYSERSATKAIFKAVKYIANEYENDKFEYSRVVSFNDINKRESDNIKKLLKGIKEAFATLTEYSKNSNI